MKVELKGYNSGKTILSRPIGYEAINIQVNESLVAGTIYPANDGTAEGVILNDVVVASGDTATVALLKKGYVNINRIPTDPESTAKAVLPMIVFEDLLTNDVAEI